MRRIEKKLWPDGFEAVAAGRKTYELRLNDFEVEEGDILVLQEWDQESGNFTGRVVEKRVGHVGRWKAGDLTVYWPREVIEEKGLQAISLLD